MSATASPPKVELDRLEEAIACPIVEGSIDDEHRRITLDILVEGFGNKSDSHIYTRDLLEEGAKAGILEGARTFKDHLTRGQEEALEGLPRPIDQVAGIIDGPT